MLKIACVVVVGLAGVSCGSPGPGEQLSSSHVDSLLSDRGARSEILWNSVEERIELCMKGHGFDYITMPYEDPDGRDDVVVPTIGSWTMDDAERFGLGVAQPAHSRVSDNKAANESLSAAEEQRWLDAYFTDCRPGSEKEVRDPWAAQIEPIRAEFRDLMAEFDRDPAVIRLRRQWSECMLLLGYQDNVGSIDQMSGHFADRFNEHVVEVAWREPNADQRAELAALIEQERAAAIDAVGCAEPLKDEYNRIWSAYQRDFLDTVDIPEFPYD